MAGKDILLICINIQYCLVELHTVLLTVSQSVNARPIRASQMLPPNTSIHGSKFTQPSTF